MLDVTRSKIADRLRRFKLVHVARRFARQQDGAAALEFAFVATPFLALTFGILQSALVFFAGQTMEAAAADAGRLIMTGQAQTLGYSKDDFKAQVCARAGTLLDCNGITADVKKYDSFTAIDTTLPIDPNTHAFDNSKIGYIPGGPSCIVVVSLYYQWKFYVSLYGDMSNMADHNRLLVATAVFRNEPYGGTGACT